MLLGASVNVARIRKSAGLIAQLGVPVAASKGHVKFLSFLPRKLGALSAVDCVQDQYDDVFPSSVKQCACELCACVCCAVRGD